MQPGNDARNFPGRTMIDADGDEVGTITTLYADREDGHPTFATVKTGMLGGNETFVPVAEATAEGDTVRVPYGKQQISSAPNIAEDGEISPEEEERLYSHYGLGSGGYATTGTTGTTGMTGGTDFDRDNDGVYDNVQGTAVGHDTSGPTTDNAMTRSEQQLNVGTEQVEAGRARLRKYIVEENVATTVPVTREQVRVEREPITDANVGQALSGQELSEEEHEVVLTEERAVVNKETVPVERVRLDTETVTENVQVNETVAKEQIDTVYPDETSTGTTSTERADRI